MKRQMYLLAVPMTDAEAKTLLRVSGKRGQDIGTFISNIVTDMHNGSGDEGDLIADYLNRSEPVEAGRSFAAYCIRYGYDLDGLPVLIKDMEEHMEAAANVERDIEAGSFPEDNGWLPGTTADEAREELAYHKAAIEDAATEKAELWDGYKKAAAMWGGGLDEAQALAEVEGFRQEAEAFQEERMTVAAKALLRNK